VERVKPAAGVFNSSLFLVIGLVVLFGVTAAALAAAAHIVLWPYPIEHFEGGCIVAAEQWAAGGPLYGDPAAGQTPIYNYPPLYPLLLRWFAGGVRPFLPGRLISLLALAGAAVAAGFAARRATGATTWGLAATGFFFTLPEIDLYAVVVRADSLAVFFSAAALFVGWRFSSRLGGLAAAAGLGVAGWFVKQTAILGPAALTLWLLTSDRRRAAQFIALYGGLMLATLGLSECASHRMFLKTMLVYPGTGFTWLRMKYFVEWHLLSHSPSHVPAWAGLLAAFIGFGRGGWRASPTPWYLALNLAALALLGKEGSSRFYFIEFSVACAIGVGVALATIERGLGRWAAVAALGVVAALAALAAPRLLHDVFAGRYERVEAQRVALLRHAGDGPLLLENVGYALLAGRRDLDLVNPFLLKRLFARGVLPLAPYLEKVRQRRYAAIALDSPAARPSLITADRYPAALLAEIARYYPPPANVGGMFFYLPPPAEAP
jgi:hypothetical protein